MRAQLLTGRWRAGMGRSHSDGRTRFQLDAMLREIASRGIWVSTHPDVTQKMGVKEVLHTTRHLGWGTDTHRYPHFDAFSG